MCDVVVGLRIFPVVEKLLVATGGSSKIYDSGSEDKDLRDVNGGSVGSKENSDGKGDRENGGAARWGFGCR